MTLTYQQQTALIHAVHATGISYAEWIKFLEGDEE